MKRLWLLLPVALLAACGPSPAAYSAVQTDLGGSVIDAQATITSAHATADASSTRMAEIAQATHSAVMAATAQAQSVIDAQSTTNAQATAWAVATSESLEVRMTEVAIAFTVAEATRAVEQANAQATAGASAQATTEAQSAANFQLLYTDTQRQLEQQRARYGMVTSLIVAALVLLVVALALFGLFILWRMWYISRHPVVAVPNQRVIVQSPFHGPSILESVSPRLAIAAESSAPPETAIALPPRVELPAMNGAHVLVVGETSTGKSGVMREVIKRRDGDVFVVDPHYRPGAWPVNVREVVGVANQYSAVEDLMMWLGEELASRVARRAQDDVDFRPVTVAMDEQPDLKSKVDAGALEVWKDLVQQGAKYAMFVIMGSQSMLVKEIGLEGESSVLRNFEYTIMLGSFAIQKSRALQALGNRAAVVVQSGRPAVPVAIPYHAHEDPRSPEFRPRAALPPVNAGVYRSVTSRPAVANMSGSAADEFFRPASEPIIIPAPVVTTDPLSYGMQTSRGFVAPSEARKIYEAAQWGWPHYRIEEHAFDGRKGGAFFYMAKDVLEALRAMNRVGSTD